MSSAMESQICQGRGMCDTMRTYIRMGEKNGTIDIQVANALSGWRIRAVMVTMGIISGMVTNHWNCCASCSEFPIAPKAAYGPSVPSTWTEDSITSITRDVFSSSTERMVAMPYMINIM